MKKIVFAVFFVIGAASAWALGSTTASPFEPETPQQLRASAVLLPDYQWHMVADAGVRLFKDKFCFDELLGEGHMPMTCGPRESMLAWRAP